MQGYFPADVSVDIKVQSILKYTNCIVATSNKNYKYGNKTVHYHTIILQNIILRHSMKEQQCCKELNRNHSYSCNSCGVHSRPYRTLCCLHAGVHVQYEGRHVACAAVHIPGAVPTLNTSVTSTPMEKANQPRRHASC